MNYTKEHNTVAGGAGGWVRDGVGGRNYPGVGPCGRGGGADVSEAWHVVVNSGEQGKYTI